MLIRRLAVVLSLFPLTAFATPYSAYNSFNTQLSRAFAVPQTTVTYESRTHYSLNTSNGGSSTSSSTPNSAAPVIQKAGASSWALPAREAPFNWGPGASTPKADPVNDQMIRLILKAKASGKRPDLTKATELELYNFYTAFGVRREEALTAALIDYREGTRMISATQSAAQDKVNAYMAKEAATRALYNQELQRVKAVALSRGDVATAQAWLDFAHPKGLWRGAFIENDPKESTEAIMHAARKGVPKGIAWAWEKFRRDDPEGFVWRDQCVALGSMRAIEAAFAFYANGPKTNYRAAVDLFERSYPQLPPKVALFGSEIEKNAAAANCAFLLSQLYARGDATLPADGAKALAWANRLPPFRQGGWEEWAHVNRVNALTKMIEHPASAQEVERELREAWVELGQLEPRSDTPTPKIQSVLAEIYSGNHPAFPNSKDPVQAETALRQVQDLAARYFEAAVWLIQFCNRTGAWDRAGATADFGVERANAALAYELGLYWRDRTDAKADLAKAITYLKLASESAPNGALALCETFLNQGRYADAEQVLSEDGKYRNHLIGFNLFRMVAERGIMQFRGDFNRDDPAAGEASFVRASFLLTIVKSPTPEQREYIRYFEFQRVASPLLFFHGKYNERDRELDEQSKEMAANPPQTPEEEKARADNLETLEIDRRINADKRRNDFQKALPKLYAMALDDYPPAQRLWAWVALSGQTKVSPEDAFTAKQFLYAAAKGGDTMSISMLGQLLLQDGQRIEAEKSAPPETLQGIYAEAADWLEAAQKNGDVGVCWPLVTIFREGLGRPKSPEKVVALLETLAVSGDAEARLELTKMKN